MKTVSLCEKTGAASNRYNRESIAFLFDRTTKKFSYDGAAWREILKKYPNSPEAVEARTHLDTLSTMKNK